MTTRQEISARIAAARQAVKPARDADSDVIEMDFSTLEDAVEQADYADIARATCIKMFREAKLDEEFVFKTRPGNGQRYLNAMRSVLARMRGKAKREKRSLDEFKLLRKSIIREKTCDVVTVVRTKATSLGALSVYDGMLTFLASGEDEEDDGIDTE